MNPPEERLRSNVAERYRALLEVARALTAAHPVEELFRTIYRETARVIDAAGFFVSLYDPATDVARVVFYADRGEERQGDHTYRGSDSEAIREKRGGIVRDHLRERSLLVLGDAGSGTTRSGISAPLLYEGEVLGVVSAQSYAPDAYDAADLELLQGIVDLAAIALANARQISVQERDRTDAERVDWIGELAAGAGLDEVAARILDTVVDRLEASGAALVLAEQSSASPLRVRVAGAAGDLLTSPVGSMIEAGSGLLGVFRADSGLPRVVTDPAELFVPAAILTRSCAGALVALLRSGHQEMGALVVGFPTKEALARAVPARLQRIGARASLALRSAFLQSQVDELGLIDALTRLPNRRHLETHLAREFAAACRGRTLSVAVFDVDDFKAFNETQGRITGDEALRAIGDALAASTRAMNLAARMGGDEFTTVLSETGAEGAREHARRVAERVAAESLLATHGLTVSYGIAEYHASMETPDDLLAAALDDLGRHGRAGERSGAAGAP